MLLNFLQALANYDTYGRCAMLCGLFLIGYSIRVVYSTLSEKGMGVPDTSAWVHTKKHVSYLNNAVVGLYLYSDWYEALSK